MDMVLDGHSISELTLHMVHLYIYIYIYIYEYIDSLHVFRIDVNIMFSYHQKKTNNL